MKTAKRRYLSATERKREILDAAFAEFSSRGFLATSLERIASRAGMSKSGIYSHYKSKHAVFEDMLLSNLLPDESALSTIAVDESLSLSQLIDRHLEHRYAASSAPNTIAAFRLLIAESGRTPELIQHCATRLLERILATDQLFIDACVSKSLVPASVKTDDYLLTGSPVALWIIYATIFGKDSSPVSAGKIKAQHRALLLNLLQSNPHPPAG